MALSFDPFAGIKGQMSKAAQAAYPFIRSLAARTPQISATAIYNQLSDAGYPLRKQTTLDLVALLRNKGDLVRFQRTFGSDTPIPDALHTYNPLGFSKGARVQYLVGIKSSNPLLPDAIYVNSKQNLSINDVFATAQAQINGTSPQLLGQGMSTVTELTIDDAKYAPDATGTGEFPAPEL